MGNRFNRGMALIFLVFAVSGCWYGGSGTRHTPLSVIRCDNPWVVRVVYQKDPHNWLINLTEIATSFSVHYRLCSSDEFIIIPMVVERVESKLGQAYLKSDMPPISCDSAGEQVEYYYETTSSNYYNRSKVYTAVVGD
jgi:hypothetical protein